MKAEKKAPSEIGGFWFKCPSKTMETATPPTSTHQSTVHQTVEENNALSVHAISHLYIFLIVFWYAIICKM